VNLTAVSLLGVSPETKSWFRVVSPQFLPAAISTAHTRTVSSRFYDPYSASPQFRTLYLSDDPVVAQFEAQVLLGSPTKPGGSVPAPRSAWVVLTARVSLSAVVDLSELPSQAVLDTSVQELTGDWEGYRVRSSATRVTVPTGAAPTQMLGEAIHRDTRRLEGFRAVSARVATNRNLIVFPDHLRSGSYVEYELHDAAGRLHTYRVDERSPDGAEI
jgi:hypothetical protein